MAGTRARKLAKLFSQQITLFWRSLILTAVFSIEAVVMSEPTPKSPIRRARRGHSKSPSSLPPIVCERCGGPVIRGQHVDPIFSAKLARWSEHPVLSKSVVLRGTISTDGSPSRVDMSLEDQLRQRAAIGGERERAELVAFEALLSKWIAAALVSKLRKEADAHGVDVLTWLARDSSKDQT